MLFLCIIALGYLMAMTYLYTSHQGHDGRPGVSIQDIADTYYGNRSGTRLEAAVCGPMAAYIQPDDRSEIVGWLKSGASEAGYTTTVAPILNTSCTGCHNPASGLPVPDIITLEGVKPLAEVDIGVSLHFDEALTHSPVRDRHPVVGSQLDFSPGGHAALAENAARIDRADLRAGVLEPAYPFSTRRDRRARSRMSPSPSTWTACRSTGRRRSSPGSACNYRARPWRTGW